VAGKPLWTIFGIQKSILRLINWGWLYGLCRFLPVGVPCDYGNQSSNETHTLEFLQLSCN